MSRGLNPGERKRLQELWVMEKTLRSEGYDRIAGVDEAGRGALAGPVIAAAVVFSDFLPIRGLNDSKQIPKNERDRLYTVITCAATGAGVGRSDPELIDRINIRQANLLAMRQAVEALPGAPDHLLIDGIDRIDWPGAQTTVVKGDARCLSIAAASVIAKVTRDRIMEAYDREYPEYGFARNKGYGAPEHLAALDRYGMCPLHRRSFHRRQSAGESPENRDGPPDS